MTCSFAPQEHKARESCLLKAVVLFSLYICTEVVKHQFVIINPCTHEAKLTLAPAAAPAPCRLCPAAVHPAEHPSQSGPSPRALLIPGLCPAAPGKCLTSVIPGDDGRFRARRRALVWVLQSRGSPARSLRTLAGNRFGCCKARCEAVLRGRDSRKGMGRAAAH